MYGFVVRSSSWFSAVWRSPCVLFLLHYAATLGKMTWNGLVVYPAWNAQKVSELVLTHLLLMGYCDTVMGPCTVCSHLRISHSMFHERIFHCLHGGFCLPIAPWVMRGGYLVSKSPVCRKILKLMGDEVRSTI